jgi:hypothetical protein
MSPAMIATLVDLGLRIAVRVMEQQSGKDFQTMTPAEMGAALRKIKIKSADELIELGRKRA